MTTATIDVERVTSAALSWPDRARAIAITTADEYVAAAETLKAIKALRGEVNATFDPIVADALKAHRTSLEQKRKTETPLIEAEGIIKTALRNWDDAQERIRIEAQRQADQEAREREENERIVRAAAMELEGHQFGDEALVDEAHALINEPAPVVVAAPVAKAVPKVAGISYRTVPKFRIVNPDLVPRQFCAPVDAKIRGVVTALGLKANIPGVEVYMERVIAAGGGR